MAEYTSQGQGTLNTVLGSIGTAGVLGGNGNLLGGLFGGGYNMAMAEKDSEIAKLKSERYTNDAVLDLYKYIDKELKEIREGACSNWAQQYVTNAQVAANIAIAQTDIGMLKGLTKTVVPIDNVCPQPMPQYNSWTAPTSTT